MPTILEIWDSSSKSVYKLTYTSAPEIQLDRGGASGIPPRKFEMELVKAKVQSGRIPNISYIGKAANNSAYYQKEKGN